MFRVLSSSMYERLKRLGRVDPNVFYAIHADEDDEKAGGARRERAVRKDEEKGRGETMTKEAE